MLKVGIVGFGRLAQAYYTPALRRLGDIEVSAIADPLQASRIAAGRFFPEATIHPRPEDLLDRPPDALLVASPPSTHLTILNMALTRGVPIFLEKPVLLYDQLRHLEAPGEARRLVMPNFNRRFWPAYQSLRGLCRNGQLGKVRRAEFTLRVDVRPWLLVTAHHVDEAEGGALYDLGSSQLDLIQYVLGEKIARLRAQARTVRWLNDLITIDAELESGVEVSCDISHAERNRERIAILGDTASAWIENPNCALHVQRSRSWRNAIVRGSADAIVFASRALIRHRSMLHYTTRSSLADFFGALASGRPFSPDFDDAVQNLICLEAATRSIAEKKSIEVSAARSTAHVG